LLFRVIFALSSHKSIFLIEEAHPQRAFALSVDGLFLLLLKLWVFVKIMILYSEKYYGDVLLQKTYIADFLQESKFPTKGSVSVICLKTITKRLFHEKCKVNT